MARAVVIEKFGEAGVLKYVERDIGEPGMGEVLIEHTAVGLNRYDVECRAGTRKVGKFPYVPGVQGVGIVRQVGADVEAIGVGDKVGYCTASGGAYSDTRIIHQRYLFRIPDDISEHVVAAGMFKAMTAHYLTHRIYDVRPGTYALVTGVSGGVGSILCQWAVYKGGKVIGTVNSEHGTVVAKQSGCSHVFDCKDENAVKEIMSITSGRGVNVVYDSIGAEASKMGFGVLGMFGLYVAFGHITGVISGISASTLSKRSWFMSSPLLHHYKGARLELGLTAMEIFEMLRRGRLKIEVGKTYKFDDIVKAHKDVERGDSQGLGIIVF